MNEAIKTIPIKFTPAVCERCGEQLAQIASPEKRDAPYKLNVPTHVCKTKKDSSSDSHK